MSMETKRTATALALGIGMVVTGVTLFVVRRRRRPRPPERPLEGWRIEAPRSSLPGCPFRTHPTDNEAMGRVNEGYVRSSEPSDWNGLVRHRASKELCEAVRSSRSRKASSDARRRLLPSPERVLSEGPVTRYA
jgi:hypothetical protein